MGASWQAQGGAKDGRQRSGGSDRVRQGRGDALTFPMPWSTRGPLPHRADVPSAPPSSTLISPEDAVVPLLSDARAE